MRSFLTFLVGLCVLVCFGVWGALFYTSLPLQVVSKLLEAMKVETQGWSGNLASEVHLDHLRTGNDDFELVLEQLFLSHQGLWDYFLKNEINISEVRVGTLSLKIKKIPPLEALSALSLLSRLPAQSYPFESWNQIMNGRVHIAKITLSNLLVELTEFKEPIRMADWQLSNVNVTNGRLEWGLATLPTSAFDLTLQESSTNSTSLATASSRDKTIQLILKSDYFKKLKHSISFEGHFKLDEGTWEKSGFFLKDTEDKITLKFDESGRIVLQINDLDFANYFNEELPLKHVNTLISLGPELADFTTWKFNQGGFEFGLHPWSLLPEGLIRTSSRPNQIQFHLAAVTEVTGARITAQLNQTIFQGPVGSDEAIHSLRSTKVAFSSEPRLSAEEILARVLFSKSYAHLGVQEKRDVAASRSDYVFQ